MWGWVEYQRSVGFWGVAELKRLALLCNAVFGVLFAYTGSGVCRSGGL